MASTSSSSTHQWQNNQVFLCFRGTDTRHRFVCHLYHALDRASVKVFMDGGFDMGEGIEFPLQVIEASLISLIIFSRGFASSRWCLDELVKIMECREKHDQKVIPVFYDVDPSDLLDPTSGIYRDEFERHEGHLRDIGDDLEKVKRWKTAMANAANLSGWNSQYTRKITEQILRLISPPVSDSSTSIDIMQEALLPSVLTADSSSSIDIIPQPVITLITNSSSFNIEHQLPISGSPSPNNPNLSFFTGIDREVAVESDIVFKIYFRTTIPIPISISSASSESLFKLFFLASRIVICNEAKKT